MKCHFNVANKTKAISYSPEYHLVVVVMMMKVQVLCSKLPAYKTNKNSFLRKN